MVFANGQDVERSVRERDSDGFRLRSICLSSIPEKAFVDA